MMHPNLAADQQRDNSRVPDTDAPRLLAELVGQAESAGASDIHLQSVGVAAEIAFRLDGVLTPARRLAGPAVERLFGRIKFLARLQTWQESLPQDGRIAGADLGAHNDLRVATYPTVTGEKIVLRLFQGSTAKTLPELGFPPDACAALESFLRQTSGLLLLTGPAGSGKTTTIHACLTQLAAQGGRHVVTIEDPVEQIIPGIMQTEVNEARGLGYATAARHLLRQDPQVLVLGEIRDDETAQLAVRAALTGHLMIATLHAGSCRGVWERLQVMCPDTYAAATAVELIVNQRLLRRRCAACGGADCAVCLQTGYRGRAPVVEWFRVDAAARARLHTEGADVIQPGESLAAAARKLVDDKLTDESEYERMFGG